MTAPPLDLRGRTVLVTGGTRGIGLAVARAFGRCGAKPILTYRWGTADEDALRRLFREDGAPEPLLLQADVANREETRALMEALGPQVDRIDTFISNATASLLVQGMEDYTERGLMQSLRAGAWPTFEYLKAIKAQFGRYPRYVVAMSSDGPDRYTDAYDFVAAGKAVLETLCRYTQFRLRHEPEPVNINVLRSRAIRTESFETTFGGEFYGFLRSFVREDWFMTVEEVADATLALCSGMFDGVKGQVVTLDRGSTFADGVSYVFDHRGPREDEPPDAL